MNFWTFEDDHTRGYYDTASNRAAMEHGARLARFFFLVFGVAGKLVLCILEQLCRLLLLIIRTIRKS